MSDEETVLLDPPELDSAPVGEELHRADYLLLAVLGVLLPALLLIGGWL
ncbi:hypothetical protein [Streptomyces sp. TP-A0874]|nr:hypothetical protein [Streptomyces sp. TP-A0874]